MYLTFDVWLVMIDKCKDPYIDCKCVANKYLKHDEKIIEPQGFKTMIVDSRSIKLQSNAF